MAASSKSILSSIPPTTDPTAQTHEEYLENHSISQYLRDAISHLVEKRPEKPLEYICEYFQNVLSGKNVRYREFQYISATKRNRLAFVLGFEQEFSSLSAKDISFEDFMLLIHLKCPDFPKTIVYRACWVSKDEKETVRFSFTELTTALNTSFFFDEYFMQIEQIYNDSLQLQQQLLKKEKLDSAIEKEKFDALISKSVVSKLKNLIISREKVLFQTPPLSIVNYSNFNYPTYRDFCGYILRNTHLSNYLQDMRKELLQLKSTYYTSLQNNLQLSRESSSEFLVPKERKRPSTGARSSTLSKK